MKRLLPLIAFLCFAFSNYAAPLLPLPNGSTAPNWTLTDENGETHTLYDYLDQGYIVYIDFFATWCSICWNYKQNGHLANLYNQYGPGGTDQVRVFSIEGDPGTPQSALYGGPGSVGNWVQGVPYPVIHAPDNAVPSAYAVVSFPTVYAVCSDRKVYNIGTANLSVLTNWISSCGLDAEETIAHAGCTGQTDGSIDLAVSGGINPISYVWSNGANTQDISNLPAGNYSCTITEGQGRSIAIGPVAVNASPPIVAFGQATMNDCGINNGALAVSAAGGTPPFTYDAGTGPSFSPIITGLSTGLYSVTVSDVYGCEKIVEVTVPSEAPPLADAGQDLLLTCDVTLVPLDGTNSSSGPNIIWQWMTEDGQIQNPGLLIPFAAEPGTYVLTVVDAATGCFSVDSVFVIADDAVPQIELSPLDTLDCAITELTMGNLNIDPCFAYAWSTTNGVISGPSDASTVTLAGPGLYFLEVTNTCTGCVATESFEVVQAAALELTDMAISDVLCAGEATGTAEVTAAGGTPPYFYEWSSGQTSNPVDDLEAGTYSVTVSDQGGCFSELGFTIQSPGSIMVYVEEVGPASGATAQDGSILALIAGGVEPYEVELYLGDVLLENADWQALAAGDYQIRIVDANGCEYWSEVITVPVLSSLKELENGLSVRIYPNPAKDMLFVEWERPLKENGELFLLNALGQVCFGQVVSEGMVRMKIELDIPNGWYGVAMRREGQWRFLGRVMIQESE